MLYLYQVTGKLSDSHNLIVSWEINRKKHTQKPAEQLFPPIIADQMSEICFSYNVGNYLVHFQSCCWHSSGGFVLAKTSYICLCWVFNVVS